MKTHETERKTFGEATLLALKMQEERHEAKEAGALGELEMDSPRGPPEGTQLCRLLASRT